MVSNSSSGSSCQIAIVAKHDFYADDIRESLLGMDLEVFSTTDIVEVEKKTDEGTRFSYVFFPHYSKIIPDLFLESHNCIGFHTGDLPMDRGGSPIQHKILKAEYSTFVSAIELVSEIDAGDLLSSEGISLEFGTIDEILKNISKAIARMVRTIITETPTPTPQTGVVGVSSRIKPQESRLDLERLTLVQIYDRIRMLDGLDYPRAYLEIGPHKFLLSEAKYGDGSLTFFAKIEER